MKTKTTFAGIPAEFAGYDSASVVLLPVPYDGTSSWIKGADKGPQAFLHAAENMELYDIETDTEVYRQGIFLNEPLDGFERPEDMVQQVYNATKKHLHKRKFITLMGGEHSISIGAMRACNEMFEDLTVLQLDAHADLRAVYEGSPYNHACAMHEINQTANLVQVGIRSMDISEKAEMNEDNVFFAHDMANNDDWMEEVMACMTDNVYITVDLDALDPSIMPATGTPEPGGLFWYETLEFLQKVFRDKNVVGFDLVELCPMPGQQASEFLAAKLYYKMLSYKYADSPADDQEEGGYYKEEKNLQNAFDDDYDEY
ncbi:agmatinase [Gilvibacter sp. SZ-19]|jgi:agmatinase|uniref:agmatinase n=1 Tax=unclassified Gilvibacter TaxID=2625242 RepID=UPI000B3D4AAF|nr:agmatinase [Gilvibacter sp. SZ-19]ARV11558.1 agmatinase [Gilvibacter sp. SZ-19]